MDQVLYGIDYIEYYFYWIYYKFIGYPLIIRICSIAVMFCIIAYLFLLFHIIYGIFKRRKEKRRYNKAFDKYYEEMKSISLDSNILSEEEINAQDHAYDVDPNSQGLVAYWKLNDGIDEIKDYSVNGNNATPSSKLTWVDVSLPAKED